MAIKKTRTQCTTCHARCGVFVYSDEDNNIVKIEGDPENPKSFGVVCGAGMSQREIHNNVEGRILYPMKRAGARGEGKWERITWDEALDLLADNCKRIAAEYGPEAIVTGQGTGRTSNHWHVRLNSSLGLEGWSLVPTHVCLMPHILPNAISMGIYSPAAGDLGNSNTIVLWGQNPAMERAFTKLMYARQDAGANLIVVDTRYQDMSKHADLAIQPRPGTDAALALGIIREVVKNKWYDQDWIDNWTYGFDELVERVEEWTPEKVAEVCQIDADDVRTAARMMGTGGPVGMMIGLGPGCMHSNAIQNGRAIACLQGLLGWIDVPGGVSVPLSFSVMLDDKITLWDSAKDPGRPDLFTFGGEEHPLYKSFGRSNDPHATFEAIITGKPRPVKAFVAIANDPLLCYENTNLTYEAMTSPNLEFIAVKDFYFSPTAKLADLVLPSADWSERCTYDEEIDGNLILAFDQAVEAPGECWDDWKFFLEWGKRIRPEDWPWENEREMVLWRLKEFYDFAPDAGRVPGRARALHRAGRPGRRARVQEVREGHAAPRRPARVPPDHHRPHRVLLPHHAGLRLRPAARLHRAGGKPHKPARAGQGIPAHPDHRPPRVLVLPFGMDEHPGPAQALPGPLRGRASRRREGLRHHRRRVDHHLVAARPHHLEGARVARDEEGRRVCAASRLARRMPRAGAARLRLGQGEREHPGSVRAGRARLRGDAHALVAVQDRIRKG